MLRRLVQIFILLPLAVLMIAFSLANRHSVTLSLDPIREEAPALSLSMPLFVLVFAVLLFGILIGGAAAWLGQARWRRQAKQEHREAARWRNRAEEAALRAGPAGAGTVPALPPQQRL